MITYKLNYGSEEQSATGQDVEIKTFTDIQQFWIYLKQRTRPDYFSGVYVVSFEWDPEQFDPLYQPEALVTRSWNNVLNYAKNPVMINTSFTFYAFEFATYNEAIEYLKTHFESSPFMYESH